VSDLNIFCATARLTRDPEVRFLAGDKQVAKVGLAISRAFTSNGQRQEETLFLDGEAWGKLADIIGKFCTKGKQVAVRGRLKLDTWEKDGHKQSKVRLVVEELTLLAGGDRSAAPASDGGEPAEPAAPRRPARPAQSRAASEAEADGGRFGGDDEPPF